MNSRDYEQLLDRILWWADSNSNIRGVMMIGSRARGVYDEWSDLDLILIAENTPPLLDESDWVHQIGDVWATHVEPAPTNFALQRRVMFAGALEVDFIIIPKSTFRTVSKDRANANIIRRGMRVLIDKDELSTSITARVATRTIYTPPSQAEFINQTNYFWHQTIGIVKRLLRHEVWVAHGICNHDLKQPLIKMLEWHAHSTLSTSPDTWYGGRFIEQWADKRALHALPETFAQYDSGDIMRALYATISLFRWLAQETAMQMQYPYPFHTEHYAIEWIESIQADVH